MTYFTSDQHFGHRNLAEVFTVTDTSGAVRPARPFTTVDHMNQALLDRYRATVSPDDTVWWLGDVCFKPSQPLIAAIAALPGTRHLILGNHDRESSTLYHRLGFTKLRSSWRPWRGVLATHIPVHPSSLPRDGVNIHGHTHHVCYPGPYVNLCVEQTAWAPVSEAEVRRRAEAALHKQHTLGES